MRVSQAPISEKPLQEESRLWLFPLVIIAEAEKALTEPFTSQGDKEGPMF